MIKISNKLLEQHGFKVGDEVEIEYTDDKITFNAQTRKRNCSGILPLGWKQLSY